MSESHKHTVEKRKLVIKEYYCSVFINFQKSDSTAGLPPLGRRSLSHGSKQGRGEDEVGLHMFSFLFQIQQSFPYHEGVISEGVERPRMLYSWGSLHIKAEKNKSTLKKECCKFPVWLQSTFPHLLLYINLSTINILILILKKSDSSLGTREWSYVL